MVLSASLGSTPDTQRWGNRQSPVARPRLFRLSIMTGMPKALARGLRTWRSTFAWVCRRGLFLFSMTRGTSMTSTGSMPTQGPRMNDGSVSGKETNTRVAWAGGADTSPSAAQRRATRYDVPGLHSTVSFFNVQGCAGNSPYPPEPRLGREHWLLIKTTSFTCWRACGTIP